MTEYILQILPGPIDNTIYVDIRREEATDSYGGVMVVTDDLRRLMNLADICYEDEQDVSHLMEKEVSIEAQLREAKDLLAKMLVDFSAAYNGGVSCPTLIYGKHFKDLGVDIDQYCIAHLEEYAASKRRHYKSTLKSLGPEAAQLYLDKAIRAEEVLNYVRA